MNRWCIYFVCIVMVGILQIGAGCSKTDNEQTERVNSEMVESRIDEWLEKKGYSRGASVSKHDDGTIRLISVGVAFGDKRIYATDKNFHSTRSALIRDACDDAMGEISRLLREDVEVSKQTDDNGMVISTTTSRSDHVLSSLSGVCTFETYDEDARMYAVCVVISYDPQLDAMVKSKKTNRMGECPIRDTLSKVPTKELLLPRFYFDNGGAVWMAGANTDQASAEKLVKMFRKCHVTTKDVSIRAIKGEQTVSEECSSRKNSFVEPLVEEGAEQMSVTDMRKKQDMGLGCACDVFVYAEKVVDGVKK